MDKKDLNKVIKVARVGGGELLRFFGKTLVAREKINASDLSTKADIASETAILKILRREFPKYNIFSEEIGKIDNGSEYTFIIDPLDGTNNFVMGVPNFTVSIGLVKNKEIVAGVVYHPILKQTYYALKDKGAFLNGKKIKVNTEDRIDHATIAHVCAYDFNIKDKVVLLNNLFSCSVKRALSSWSVANDLCLLASGKIEAVIIDNAERYDFCAGKIIACEAGAKVTDLKGELEKNDLNRRFLISGNITLHNKIIKLLSL